MMTVKQQFARQRCFNPRVMFFPKLMRSLSMIIVFSMIMPYLGFAFNGMVFQPESGSASQFLSRSQSIPTINILPDLGKITNSHQATSDQLVVVLYDLHCHYEVQYHISELIKDLSKKHQLCLVGVEGDSAVIDTTKLRSFPKKHIREEVAQYFMRRGYLSGAEYAAITSEQPLIVQGIENQNLYETNKETLYQFFNYESEGICFDITEAIEALKPKVFSDRLRQLDKLRVKYQENNDQKTYLKALLQVAVTNEIKVDHVLPLTNLDDLKNVVTFFDLHQEKREAVIQEFEQVIRGHFYRDEDERRLDYYHTMMSIIDKMLHISATEKELKIYYEQQDRFAVSAMLDFIEELSSRHNMMTMLDLDSYRLSDYLNLVEKFYSDARKRSYAFVDNLKHHMQEKNESLAVLISGGFHANHIEESLKHQNVNFIAIQPRMTNHDVANPYFALLRNRRTSLERLLTKQEKLFKQSSYINQPRMSRVMDMVTKIADINDSLRMSPARTRAEIKAAHLRTLNQWQHHARDLTIDVSSLISMRSLNLYAFRVIDGMTRKLFWVVVRPNGLKLEYRSVSSEALNDHYTFDVLDSKQGAANRKNMEAFIRQAATAKSSLSLIPSFSQFMQWPVVQTLSQVGRRIKTQLPARWAVWHNQFQTWRTKIIGHHFWKRAFKLGAGTVAILSLGVFSAAARAADAVYHTVSGDYLGHIAQRMGVGYSNHEKIQAANPDAFTAGGYLKTDAELSFTDIDPAAIAEKSRHAMGEVEIIDERVPVSSVQEVIDQVAPITNEQTTQVAADNLSTMSNTVGMPAEALPPAAMPGNESLLVPNDQLETVLNMLTPNTIMDGYQPIAASSASPELAMPTTWFHDSIAPLLDMVTNLPVEILGVMMGLVVYLAIMAAIHYFLPRLVKWVNTKVEHRGKWLSAAKFALMGVALFLTLLPSSLNGFTGINIVAGLWMATFLLTGRRVLNNLNTNNSHSYHTLTLKESWLAVMASATFLVLASHLPIIAPAAAFFYLVNGLKFTWCAYRLVRSYGLKGLTMIDVPVTALGRTAGQLEPDPGLRVGNKKKETFFIVAHQDFAYPFISTAINRVLKLPIFKFRSIDAIRTAAERARQAGHQPPMSYFLVNILLLKSLSHAIDFLFYVPALAKNGRYKPELGWIWMILYAGVFLQFVWMLHSMFVFALAVVLALAVSIYSFIKIRALDKKKSNEVNMGDVLYSAPTKFFGIPAMTVFGVPLARVSSLIWYLSRVSWKYFFNVKTGKTTGKIWKDLWSAAQSDSTKFFPAMIIAALFMFLINDNLVFKTVWTIGSAAYVIFDSGPRFYSYTTTFLINQLSNFILKYNLNRLSAGWLKNAKTSNQHFTQEDVNERLIPVIEELRARYPGLIDQLPAIKILPDTKLKLGQAVRLLGDIDKDGTFLINPNLALLDFNGQVAVLHYMFKIYNGHSYYAATLSEYYSLSRVFNQLWQIVSYPSQQQAVFLMAAGAIGLVGTLLLALGGAVGTVALAGMTAGTLLLLLWGMAHYQLKKIYSVISLDGPASFQKHQLAVNIARSEGYGYVNVVHIQRALTWAVVQHFKKNNLELDKIDLDRYQEMIGFIFDHAQAEPKFNAHTGEISIRVALPRLNTSADQTLDQHAKRRSLLANQHDLEEIDRDDSRVLLDHLELDIDTILQPEIKAMSKQLFNHPVVGERLLREIDKNLQQVAAKQRKLVVLGHRHTAAYRLLGDRAKKNVDIFVTDHHPKVSAEPHPDALPIDMRYLPISGAIRKIKHALKNRRSQTKAFRFRSILQRNSNTWIGLAELTGMDDIRAMYGKDIAAVLEEEFTTVINNVLTPGFIYAFKGMKAYKEMSDFAAHSRAAFVMNGKLKRKKVKAILEYVRDRVVAQMEKKYAVYKVMMPSDQLKKIADRLNAKYQDPSLVRVMHDRLRGDRLLIRMDRHDLTDQFIEYLGQDLQIDHLDLDNRQGHLIVEVITKELGRVSMLPITVQGLSQTTLSTELGAEQAKGLVYLPMADLAFGVTKFSHVYPETEQRQINTKHASGSLTPFELGRWVQDSILRAKYFLENAVKSQEKKVVVDKGNHRSHLKPTKLRYGGTIKLFHESFKAVLKDRQTRYGMNAAIRDDKGYPFYDQDAPWAFTEFGLKQAIQSQLEYGHKLKTFNPVLMLAHLSPQRYHQVDRVRLAIVTGEQTHFIDINWTVENHKQFKERHLMAAAIMTIITQSNLETLLLTQSPHESIPVLLQAVEEKINMVTNSRIQVSAQAGSANTAELVEEQGYQQLDEKVNIAFLAADHLSSDQPLVYHDELHHPARQTIKRKSREIARQWLEGRAANRGQDHSAFVVPKPQSEMVGLLRRASRAAAVLGFYIIGPVLFWTMSLPQSVSANEENLSGIRKSMSWDLSEMLFQDRSVFMVLAMALATLLIFSTETAAKMMKKITKRAKKAFNTLVLLPNYQYEGDQKKSIAWLVVLITGLSVASGNLLTMLGILTMTQVLCLANVLTLLLMSALLGELMHEILKTWTNSSPTSRKNNRLTSIRTGLMVVKNSLLEWLHQDAFGSEVLMKRKKWLLLVVPLVIFFTASLQHQQIVLMSILAFFWVLMRWNIKEDRIKKKSSLAVIKHKPVITDENNDVLSAVSQTKALGIEAQPQVARGWTRKIIDRSWQRLQASRLGRMMELEISLRKNMLYWLPFLMALGLTVINQSWQSYLPVIPFLLVLVVIIKQNRRPWTMKKQIKWLHGFIGLAEKNNNDLWRLLKNSTRLTRAALLLNAVKYDLIGSVLHHDQFQVALPDLSDRLKDIKQEIEPLFDHMLGAVQETLSHPDMPEHITNDNSRLVYHVRRISQNIDDLKNLGGILNVKTADAFDQSVDQLLDLYYRYTPKSRISVDREDLKRLWSSDRRQALQQNLYYLIARDIVYNLQIVHKQFEIWQTTPNEVEQSFHPLVQKAYIQVALLKDILSLNRLADIDEPESQVSPKHMAALIQRWLQTRTGDGAIDVVVEQNSLDKNYQLKIPYGRLYSMIIRLVEAWEHDAAWQQSGQTPELRIAIYTDRVVISQVGQREVVATDQSRHDTVERQSLNQVIEAISQQIPPLRARLATHEGNDHRKQIELLFHKATVTPEQHPTVFERQLKADQFKIATVEPIDQSRKKLAYPLVFTTIGALLISLPGVADSAQWPLINTGTEMMAGGNLTGWLIIGTMALSLMVLRLGFHAWIHQPAEVNLESEQEKRLQSLLGIDKMAVADQPAIRPLSTLHQGDQSATLWQKLTWRLPSVVYHSGDNHGLYIADWLLATAINLQNQSPASFGYQLRKSALKKNLVKSIQRAIALDELNTGDRSVNKQVGLEKVVTMIKGWIMTKGAAPFVMISALIGAIILGSMAAVVGLPVMTAAIIGQVLVGIVSMIVTRGMVLRYQLPPLVTQDLAFGPGRTGLSQSEKYVNREGKSWAVDTSDLFRLVFQALRAAEPKQGPDFEQAVKRQLDQAVKVGFAQSPETLLELIKQNRFAEFVWSETMAEALKTSVSATNYNLDTAVLSFLLNQDQSGQAPVTADFPAQTDDLIYMLNTPAVYRQLLDLANQHPLSKTTSYLDDIKTGLAALLQLSQAAGDSPLIPIDQTVKNHLLPYIAGVNRTSAGISKLDLGKDMEFHAAATNGTYTAKTFSGSNGKPVELPVPTILRLSGNKRIGIDWLEQINNQQVSVSEYQPMQPRSAGGWQQLKQWVTSVIIAAAVAMPNQTVRGLLQRQALRLDLEKTILLLSRRAGLGQRLSAILADPDSGLRKQLAEEVNDDFPRAQLALLKTCTRLLRHHPPEQQWTGDVIKLMNLLAPLSQKEAGRLADERMMLPNLLWQHKGELGFMKDHLNNYLEFRSSQDFDNSIQRRQLRSVLQAA